MGPGETWAERVGKKGYHITRVTHCVLGIFGDSSIDTSVTGQVFHLELDVC